jgi:OFA family oxalate/formate antiporter-like MFS transporter
MGLKFGKMRSDYHLFRWIVLAAGFAINVCLGILYAWSVFVPTLEGEFGWTRMEVALPFVIATLSFSFGMIFTGRWQDKSSPRLVALCGAVLAGGGYMLSSLAGSLPHLLITYGLIAGLGNAAGYIAAVSTGLKWFPDKRGLASGIVVGGYGLGALVFAPMATHMIAIAGWRVSFTILGASFLAIIGICSLVLKNPPQGWVPTGSKVTLTSSSKLNSLGQGSREMLKTSRFYMLWMIFFLSCLAGLMIIASLKPFAMASAGLGPMEAAIAVSILSAFNFIGRIALGWVSDVIGRIKTLAMVSAIIAVNMLLFPMYGTIILVYIGAAITGLCFGTNLGLFPAITADNWGTRHLGVNYGIMLTAWGIGGLAGPVIGGYMYDVTGRYTYAFWIGSILAIVTLILMYIVTRKRFEYREYSGHA